MARQRPTGDDDVPRLPRGKGFALSPTQLVRILSVTAALVAVLVLTKPCANATSKFVTDFDRPDARVEAVDARPAPAQGGTLLRADMTPEEMRAAIEKERAGAAAGADAGVDAGSGAAPR